MQGRLSGQSGCHTGYGRRMAKGKTLVCTWLQIFPKNLPKKIGNFLAAFGHQSPEFFSIGAKLTRYLEVELTYWKDLNSIP